MGGYEPRYGHLPTASVTLCVACECVCACAKRNSKADAPVLLWLQGGPGASSLFGMFTEIGNPSIPRTAACTHALTRVPKRIRMRSPPHGRCLRSLTRTRTRRCQRSRTRQKPSCSGVRAGSSSTFCGVEIAGPFNIDNQLNVLPRDLSWNEVRVAPDHETEGRSPIAWGSHNSKRNRYNGGDEDSDYRQTPPICCAAVPRGNAAAPRGCFVCLRAGLPPALPG